MGDINRIFWSAEEKRIVATESFRLLGHSKEVGTVAATVKMAAIGKAQIRRLPKERHRPLDKVDFKKFEPWITPLWNEMAGVKQAEAKQKAEDLFTGPVQQHVEIQAEPEAQPTSPPKDDTLPEIEGGFKHPEPPTSPAPIVDEIRHMVRWVDSEKMTLARGVVNRTKDGGVERLDALRSTISLDLPDYRRRDISTWHMVEAWIEPMLKQAKTDMLLEEIAAREAHEQALRDEAAAAEAARLEQQRHIDEAREREQEIERRVAARVNTLSFDALIRAFARKLAHDTLTAIRDEMHSGLTDELMEAMTAPSTPTIQEPDKEEAFTPVTPAPRLPRIMVVGLWPKQEQDVKKAFLGAFDIVFVPNSKEGGQGAGGNGMLAKADGCEVVIGMIDSMGLDVHQKRKHLRRPFVQIAGSASNLKRWIGAYKEGNVELPKVGSDE